MVMTFPRLFDPVEEGLPPAVLLHGGEASCFYHADKEASAVCDHCGRFICSLCDMQMDDRHLCPSCLASGAKKETIKDVQRSRTRYDNVALGAAIGSVLTVGTIVMPLFLAPATLFIVIKYWNKPVSLVHSGRVRFVLAFLLASAQIGLGAWAIIAIIGG
jgi:hypothetical protein